MDERKILIVEDHWESSDLIADVIRLTFKSWDVEQVTSSQDAIEKAGSVEYDMIIIDLALSDGVTGLEIIRKIVGLKPHSQTRFILVTGLGDKNLHGSDASKHWMNQLQEDERSRVDGFFQKPYAWKEFLATLATATGSVLPDKVKLFNQEAA